MTRDEVARECEKAGWRLTHETCNAYSMFDDYLCRDSEGRVVGSGANELLAFLDACNREGRSPF